MTFDRRQFFNEFIDDFYSESEEHLANVRRQLLALESGANQTEVLDELLRSFHTLKGLSSMVGSAEIEQVAHHTEEYLRQLKSGLMAPSAEGTDALIEVTADLETAIGALRRNEPPPDFTGLVTRVMALAVSDENRNEQRVPTDLEDEGKLWRFEFRPSPELASRGIGVGLVRDRLQALGRIVRVSPHIGTNGEVLFELMVKTNAEEETFAAELGEGVAWTAAEEPQPAVEKPPQKPHSEGQTIVRVEMSRLDDLMRIVGELVTHRWRLDESLKPLERQLSHTDWRKVQEAGAAIERELRDLRAAVMRVRMIPINQIFERMRFVVYALERETDKKIRLELSGENTEVDKLVVERMMEPLLHIVRNAVSHGLENKAERAAAGKPVEGTLLLRAATVSENVVITIEDDGRGIDFDVVTQRGRAIGVLGPQETVDEATLLRVLATPGFSTREKADLASGRGVGMAVVGRTVSELGGTLSVKTVQGRGTRFTIKLPLTLAIADALIVAVDNERYAMPQVAVEEIVRVEAPSVVRAATGELVPYRGATLPLIRLADIFGLQQKRKDAFHVLVVGQNGSSVGLAVDRVLSHREIVVRSIADPLMHTPSFSGATEVGDGRPILIIDPETLIKHVLGQGPKGRLYARS